MLPYFRLFGLEGLGASFQGGDFVMVEIVHEIQEPLYMRGGGWLRLLGRLIRGAGLCRDHRIDRNRKPFGKLQDCIEIRVGV